MKIESLNYYLNKLPKSIIRKSQINLKVKNPKVNNTNDFFYYSDKNNLNLIYFGRISREKGIDIFLRSLKRILSNNDRIPNIHLHFFGDGNKEYLNSIKEIMLCN